MVATLLFRHLLGGFGEWFLSLRKKDLLHLTVFHVVLRVMQTSGGGIFHRGSGDTIMWRNRHEWHNILQLQFSRARFSRKISTSTVRGQLY